jgi:hypothetical protein
MYRLVITTRLPTRHITPKLQIQIVVIRITQLAHQPVQLCNSFVSHRRPLPPNSARIRSLTPSITTPLHSNNRISLQSPRRRARTRFPLQRLVTRRRILDVQVLSCLSRLDGTADGEVVGAGFGAEDGGGGRFGAGLEVEMKYGVADTTDLADGGCAGG